MRWIAPLAGLFLAACGGEEPKTPDQVEKTPIAKVETHAAIDAVACDDSHPCGSGQKCQNGHCVAPPNGGPGCTDFPPPKFQFESSELLSESKATLDRLAGCLGDRKSVV